MRLAYWVALGACIGCGGGPTTPSDGGGSGGSGMAMGARGGTTASGAGGTSNAGKGGAGNINTGGIQTGNVTTGKGKVGNINTGNNRYSSSAQQRQADDPSANPADTERTFQQQLRELNQLRQILKDDPQASKEAEELARQMQHLDPRRFPGNPAMVEEMHREVLSTIDRLELQLVRSATASLASRTGKPQAVPDGYQDSVAEYYRSLSKTP